MYFANGFTLVGEWTDGQMSGLGILESKKGEKYIGNFKNGIKNGQGLQ